MRVTRRDQTVGQHGEKILESKIKKVVILSSSPILKNLFDKLISAVIQGEGNERSLLWSLNNDGTPDLFTG
jgi:hypothetical protein